MPADPAKPERPEGVDDRAVWRIAGPMMLSNISIPLLGMVDTGVMGHLPDPRYLGAVAVGATLFNALFLSLNFLRMGTTGLTAQAYGREDGDSLRTGLAQALAVALGLSLLLIVFQVPLREAGIALIAPSQAVATEARIYLDIRIWSAPAVLANYVLLGWFLGLQDGRRPLLLLLVVNGTNILLDLILVIGLGLFTEGVASATVAAEYLGLAVALNMLRGRLRAHPGRWSRHAIFSRVVIARLFAINRDLFVRTLTLMFAFAFVTAQGARMGDVVLAANAVLLTFQSFMAYGLDGFAHAAEALVGRAAGVGSRVALDRAIRTCLRWALIFALAFTVIYAVFGTGIIRLLTDLSEVRTAAITYLPWIVASPLVSVWSFHYDGVYVGATRAREMRDTMLVSFGLVFLPVWWLTTAWGNHGLWFAFLCFLGARGITLHMLYRWLESREGFVVDLGPAPDRA